MKKRTLSLIIIILSFTLLAGCSYFGVKAPSIAATDKSGTGNETNISDVNSLSIVTTLFPHYDFTRAIVGDRASVTLLLPPGVESHSFEPTPADIIKINNCDLFIYTGANMEAWADRILDGADGDQFKVVALADGIELESEHDEDEHADEAHLHEFDPHIWTSPIIAKEMVDHILTALCEIDPEGADYYTENAESYKAELDGLDAEFRLLVESAKRHEIYVGDRFALRYFAEAYDLDVYSAFDSCSAETEPSAAVIAEMIDRIKANDIPVIYYGELTEPNVARSLSQSTGAEMLLLHSCHNVTADDFERGVTYIDLMKQNAENLRKGLN